MRRLVAAFQNAVNRKIEGWLFDIDELGPEVALWIKTDQGDMVRVTEKFSPAVYVRGETEKLKALAGEVQRRGILSTVRWTEKIEFWSGDTVPVLQLDVLDSSLMLKLRRIAASHDREFVFYNCDIPAAQYYLYTKRLFPFCRIACIADQEDAVVEVAATDSPWDRDCTVPELSMLRMRGEKMRPLSDKSQIIMEYMGECSGQYSGNSVAVKLSEGRAAIVAVNGVLNGFNPDLILTEYGDTVLIPALLTLARDSKMELRLDRERIAVRRRIQTEGRTYFTYGKIVYRGPSYPLFGRWHIDRNNSFIYRETGMDGLVELSRLAKIPPQRMARTTPGSAMSSMEMDLAVQDGIMVPWHKSEPESYKTALDLLTVDKGGLVYQPPVAAIERVAEIDFASMYPSIMTGHNISPETVLCGCCENQKVPEAGYNVCEKRRGLVSRTLEPLLDRRAQYKKLIKSCSAPVLRDKYDSRQTAIKWMLVSCFGYLGYKNARFGRIEAHEAVTAFGREKLLCAKEIAEAAGYSVLHALTDCLWIKLRGEGEPEMLQLCERIHGVTGIDMSLEGIYNWIVFLPSKVNEARPVATRYHGVFSDGKVKIRGLACRRSDVPDYIKEVQLELLSIVAAAVTLDERILMISQAEVVLNARIAELESGTVNPLRLLLRRTLTQEIDDYAVQTRTALAAGQLRDAGIRVHPGQSVSYVITDAGSKNRSARVRAEEIANDCGYDAAEYVKLLKAAAAEVLWSGAEAKAASPSYPLFER
jgi:DNA polymerase-2